MHEQTDTCTYTHTTQATCAHTHKVKPCIAWIDMCKFYLVLTDLQGEGAVRQVGHAFSVVSRSQRKVELHTSWYSKRPIVYSYHSIPLPL